MCAWGRSVAEAHHYPPKHKHMTMAAWWPLLPASTSLLLTHQLMTDGLADKDVTGFTADILVPGIPAGLARAVSVTPAQPGLTPQLDVVSLAGQGFYYLLHPTVKERHCECQ